MPFSECRSCHAKIIWMKTAEKRNIPVDYQPGIENEKQFNPRRMVSHFATCPDSKKWRKSHHEADKFKPQQAQPV